MRVVVIRHHSIDSAGLIGAAFTEIGADLSMHHFPRDGDLPDLAGVDHVVVLGSVHSVNDGGAPGEWIAAELSWLRQADQAGIPVLGICFGAQALCAALGGTVEQAPAKEVGWVLVDSADQDLIPAGPWLEFHGDRCLPPAGATVLASNDAGAQAFSIGSHLAVQFHPEADGEQLRLWLDAGGRAEAEQAGQDPAAFLAQTYAQDNDARKRAAQIVAAARRLAQPG
ncbi:MAG TPA: gamma-glutamyl-gamma-aminobutyrate hydrolase family protein [Streptosporangiaceae bacterium]|jgi:GMP synthase-like glutamine amidotransferase